MSKHSRSYLEKEKELTDKEAILRKDLDQESEVSQKKIISFLKTSGAVIACLGVGYLFYRIVMEPADSPTKSKKKSKKEKHSKAKANPLIQKLSSQLIAIGVKFAMSFVETLLEKKEKK